MMIKFYSFYYNVAIYFRLPECEDLPKYNKSGIPTCSYVGLVEMNSNEISCKFIFLVSSLNSIIYYL